jgi:glutamate synthase (ferredoxin)
MPHAAMMMIPEPWENHESMSDEKRAFYEYHSCLMEPWDGPASIAFTDGIVVGACLDRNGLRPSRYYVTKDDVIVLAS